MFLIKKFTFRVFNCINILNEHMCTPELAPVIVITETGPKYKLLSTYGGSIVSQMNFNDTVERKNIFMETSKLFSEAFMKTTHTMVSFT